jgi:hypothetical protein
MTEGKRPGGLTALAVFNFIFGAYDCLQVLGAAVLIVILATTVVPEESGESDETTNAEAQEDERDRQPQDPREAMAEQWRKSGLGIHILYIKGACYLVLAFLLISSGVGFLRQSRVWGRWMGNAYAIVSIGTTGFEFSLIPEEVGRFSILAILFLIYPLLVLILLNTTFRGDFVT